MTFPNYDFEAEAAAELNRLRALVAEHEACQSLRPPVDYTFQPQQQGFVHTPEGGAAVVALIQQCGYPKAKLVGSLAEGRTSQKDIDVLIPLFFKRDKLQCVKALESLFNPNHMASCRGFDGFGMVAKPHGVIDLFFNSRNK